ncbi:MAG: lipocalin family protein [Candidatus Marinimicrobia bacterium]|nr:lipocalin family protein [Candidatus Neomarinimicrobiota bacterium]
MITAADKASEQKLVDTVDIPRFMGDWYVIANIPTIFEKGAVNAIENYTWNEEKGIVDVTFTYRADSLQGKLKRMTQRGFIYDTASNAEWRVQPIWPLRLGYLIIDLAEDYSYTVIGVPNRKYLWIMARESTLSEDIYTAILDRIATQGYDVGLIQKVPQIWD